ncbi:hypothetical protein HAX54_052468 [Datura stramonium]|uniref:Uncharacterized protein n=1 Tax=Datura stramonium TaxID=4076 RepID=A0ABS8WNI3_DATST|nr:hypothetical protein [Datura stramonium]
MHLASLARGSVEHAPSGPRTRSAWACAQGPRAQPPGACPQRPSPSTGMGMPPSFPLMRTVWACPPASLAISRHGHGLNVSRTRPTWAFPQRPSPSASTVGMGLSQRLVNRHAAAVGIIRYGLLAIDETRLCLCVWQLAASTGPSQRLVKRQAAAVGNTRYNLLNIDEARLCLCVRQLAAGTGQSQRLVNRHAAGLSLALQVWHQQQRTTSNVGRLRLDPCVSSDVLTHIPSQSWDRHKLGLLEVGFLCWLPNAQVLSCTIGCLLPIARHVRAKPKGTLMYHVFLASSCDVVVHEKQLQPSDSVNIVGVGSSLPPICPNDACLE